MKKIFFLPIGLLLLIPGHLLLAQSASSVNSSYNITNFSIYNGADAYTGNKEVAATFNLDIEATSSAIKFYKEGSQVINDLGVAGTTTLQSVSGNVVDNGTYYTIPAGNIGIITFLSLWSPLDMPSGSHLILFEFSSGVTPPSPSLPKATLTANGAHAVVLEPGNTIKYVWTSKNATKFSSTYTSNNPSKCGKGVWVANSASGALGPLSITSNSVGCFYLIKYTATQSATGLTASDTVEMAIVQKTAFATPSSLTASAYDAVSSTLNKIVQFFKSAF